MKDSYKLDPISGESIKTIDTGGSAFPFTRKETLREQCQRVGNDNNISQKEDVVVLGMSLRDYFSAQALVGITQLYPIPSKEGSDSDAPQRKARLAKHCWEMADAMLEARNK